MSVRLKSQQDKTCFESYDAWVWGDETFETREDKSTNFIKAWPVFGELFLRLYRFSVCIYFLVF